MEVPKQFPQFFTTVKACQGSIIEITSCEVIKIKDWFVRVSTTTSLDSICIVMLHQKTLFTNIAFFTDEILAHEYIKKIVSS